ncbi:hypothetical protein NQ109_24100 [Priestia megaterium]|uniref:hypothetical protein n=1 Tax=Priestia megaterium TaxID=1404 RepID=UPI000BF8A17F|nr:hypothetical protein [Priestia megaterium]MCR8866020.1 hypothetical protein [Priestia megaterium]PFK64875.1 hypothetical protein COJ21_25285 [Priestia megaterium]RFB20957.1 hypothetical protein DZB87_26230 [Bacillus sp. ALD]RFB32603.1 hypothetical protein DZB86_29660 [Bacillus sp. RC]
MNTILEDFYELREILSSFDNLQNNYNWLLTDLDGSLPDVYLDYFIDYRTYPKEARGSIYWITGEKLTELANKEDIYFAWGVFSAFNKNEHIDLDMLKEEPYADGNPNFWVERPKIQHSKATTELVLWDAGLVLLLSKDEKISTNFRNKFKEFKSLEVYNKEPF